MTAPNQLGAQHCQTADSVAREQRQCTARQSETTSCCTCVRSACTKPVVLLLLPLAHTSQSLPVPFWAPVRIFAFERNRSKHAKDPRKWRLAPQHTAHVPESRTSSLLAVAVLLILSVIFRTKVRSYFSATIYDLVRRESERASERTGTDCVHTQHTMCVCVCVRVCCAPKTLEFKFECCLSVTLFETHTKM